MLGSETNYSTVIRAQHSKGRGQIKSSDGALSGLRTLAVTGDLEDYDS